MASKLDTIISGQQAQATLLAAVKQRLDDDHEHVFGGPGREGALKYLANNDEKISAALAQATKDFTAALTIVKADIVELKTEKRLTKAWAGGAVGVGTALGYLIKTGLLKVGIHVP